MSRDNFSKGVQDVIAKRVGVKCSNPACKKPTSGPRSEIENTINIGVAAHITAAAKGGPRYNSSLAADQRGSAENGIWLCQNCAKLVDNDPTRYTVEILHEWKTQAESEALTHIEGDQSARDNFIDIDISSKNKKITGDRHDYELKIRLINKGKTAVTSGHVDLEIPAAVVESPDSDNAFVASRSNQQVCLFRKNLEKLYPGDAVVIFSIPYYMDHELFALKESFFESPIKVTLYQEGKEPFAVQDIFGRYQVF